MVENKFQKALLCGTSFPSRRLKQGPVSHQLKLHSIHPLLLLSQIYFTPSPKQWADAHPAEAHPVIQEATQELSTCTRWGTIRHAFKLHANSQVKEPDRKMYEHEKFPGASVCER